VSANDAERRLEAGDSTIGCRPAHRRSRLGAVGKRPDAGSHRGSGTAARSAGDAIYIPRIVDRTEVGKRRRAAVAELVEIRLADDDRTGCAQAFN
jgi:hypothetical protein